MKFSIALALLAATATEAFAPSAFGIRSSTQLAARVDTTNLIQEALAASKEFGASSKEARLAWETVEEMDSSDNSEATKGSLDECEIESVTDACLEYGEKVAELEKLLQLQKPTLDALQTMAAEVQQVKLAIPEPKPASRSPELSAAFLAAKQISEEKGVTSSEAAVAWETVEEIASAGSGNALGGKMDDECLIDAAKEACAAIEELNRVLNMQK